MAGKLSNSFALVKASANVLKMDKELMVFPLMSGVATLLVAASFIAPIFMMGPSLIGPDGETLSYSAYVLGFLFYLIQYFVIFFFNAALVGAAMIRLDGGNPTLGDGLRIATSRISAIAGYALIAATVGMILRAIQERVGFVGKIIVGILGVGWAIATYMVVPVLVVQKVGPIDAIKESAGLLKKTWGENVIGQAGIGLAFGLIFMAVIFCGAVVLFFAFATGSVAVIVTAAVLVLLAVGITGLVQAALGGIYAAALYRYASTGKPTPGFQPETLKLAFAPK